MSLCCEGKDRTCGLHRKAKELMCGFVFSPQELHVPHWNLCLGAQQLPLGGEGNWIRDHTLHSLLLSHRVFSIDLLSDKDCAHWIDFLSPSPLPDI